MLWFIEVGLFLLAVIQVFSVLNVILPIVFLWFYFWTWKTMNGNAAAFVIVIKTLAVLFGVSYATFIKGITGTQSFLTF